MNVRLRRLLLRTGAAVYRAALLLLLPPGFRREFGGRMASAFDRRGAALARSRGTGALLGWWARAAADLARSVAREWTETLSGRGMMGSMGSARQTVRRYARAPVWSLAALATLVAGVGAMTGMVSLVWESLVRPLPFDRPEELVQVSAIPVEQGEPLRFSLDLLETWQAEEAGDIPIAGYATTRVPMDLGDGPEYVDSGYATGELMELLGVEPVAGRIFAPEDGREGAPPTVVLTEELWRNELGADPGVVGRSVRLGSNDYTVIGVVGPELATLLPGARLWMATATFPRSPYITVLEAVGRVAPGTAPEVLADRLAAVRVTNSAGVTFAGRAEPLREALVADVRAVLLAFLAVVGGLLLIGVINLANLFLGRGVSLEGDREVRRALGATPGRIVGEAVLDAVLLGLAGGLGGLVLGLWIRRTVIAWSPVAIPGLGDAPTGLVEGGVAVALSVLLCATLALVTTLPASRRGRRGGLGSRSARVAGGRRIRRVQRGLTVIQVAATFVLLTGSALLARTFGHLTSVDAGFDPEPVAGLQFSLPPDAYPDSASWETFTRRMVDEVRTLPGVVDAVAVDRPLFTSLARTSVEVEGADPGPGAPMPVLLEAMPGFLAVMGIPLRRGRALGSEDTRDAVPVAVVSEAFAERFFPGGDALGRRIRRGEDAPWITVVGVMADLRATGPTGEVEPTVLLPMDQAGAWGRFVSVVFRAQGDPGRILPGARARLRELEPGAAVLEIGTYTRWLSAMPGFAESRFRALVVGLLGAVALLLALVGVYGLTAYSVRKRTRELGIRIALGGGERRVLGRVLAEGARLALLGIGLGAGTAWFAVSGLERFLQGMPARDPAVFAAVGAALAAVALLACLRPALAASRVAPIEALREE